MDESGVEVEPRRPITLAIAVVGLMVVAALGVLEGALILLMRYDEDLIAAGLVLAVSLTGAASILFALLLGAIAAGVWRGSRGARIVATVVSVAGLALDAVTLSASATGLWWTVIDVVFYLYVIGALWLGARTMAFFKRRPARAAASAAA